MTSLNEIFHTPYRHSIHTTSLYNGNKVLMISHLDFYHNSDYSCLLIFIHPSSSAIHTISHTVLFHLTGIQIIHNLASTTSTNNNQFPIPERYCKRWHRKLSLTKVIISIRIETTVPPVYMTTGIGRPPFLNKRFFQLHHNNFWWSNLNIACTDTQ